jgi:pentatricopeptide repeat protein
MLISLYSRCGCLDDASKVFDAMRNRDVVSSNVNIVGYANGGLFSVIKRSSFARI